MERDDDYLDFDDGDQWERTHEHYKCAGCGHVGPALAKVCQELQGESPMVGYVGFETGDLRCTECDHDELDEIGVIDPSLSERHSGE